MAQQANPFRVSAYRHAADAVEHIAPDVRSIAETGGHPALEAIPGVGRSIAGALAELLTRIRPHTARVADEPDVALLLDVDREYREKAASGMLRKIAPKRFDPSGEAWLPVPHTARGPWHSTVLWSNTARAHQLERTGDWVVVYFHRSYRELGWRDARRKNDSTADARR